MFSVKSNNSNSGTLDSESKPYLTPFKCAIRVLGLEDHIPEKFELTHDQLNAFLVIMLRGVDFDERFYLHRYPDIKEAIALGLFKSAKDHFVEHGYCEGRYPTRVVVDEAWYLNTYPDVAEGVELGEIHSAQEHFDNYGRDEGRLPHQE